MHPQFSRQNFVKAENDVAHTTCRAVLLECGIRLGLLLCCRASMLCSSATLARKTKSIAVAILVKMSKRINSIEPVCSVAAEEEEHLQAVVLGVSYHLKPLNCDEAEGEFSSIHPNIPVILKKTNEQSTRKLPLPHVAS